MKYITKALLEAGQSRRGGLNREQLAVLGVAWPPKHGWFRRLVGKQITAAQEARFLSLKEAGKCQNRPPKWTASVHVRVGDIPLPFPNGGTRKNFLTVQSLWAYIQRLPKEQIAELCPALRFMAGKATQLAAGEVEVEPEQPEQPVDDLDESPFRVDK